MRGKRIYKDQFTPFVPFVFWINPAEDVSDGYSKNNMSLSQLGRVVADTVYEVDVIIAKLMSIKN